MSVPAPERAIVDAGLKALAFDSGLPVVHVARGLEYVEGAPTSTACSRSIPRRRSRRSAIACGSFPGTAIPTVNLYDWIVGMRGERVECVWPVAARGALG